MTGTTPPAGLTFWESMTLLPYELIPFADWIFDRGGWRQVTAVQSSDEITYFWVQPIPGLSCAYFLPNDGRKLYISRRCA